MNPSAKTVISAQSLSACSKPLPICKLRLNHQNSLNYLALSNFSSRCGLSAACNSLNLVSRARSAHKHTRFRTQSCQISSIFHPACIPSPSGVAASFRYYEFTPDGATATHLIRQQCPHTNVVVLTSFKDEAVVQGALQAGATSYLLKDVTAGALADTIRRAHAGHSTLAPEAAEALIHSARHPGTLGHDLTARERDILAQMVRGLNNSEIAEQLVVSRSTVKFHVSNILSKFGVDGRTEAVALAVQHHLVT